MVLNREEEVLGITDPSASRPLDSDKPPENCFTPGILSGTSTWPPPSNIFGNTEPWELSERAQSRAGSSFLGSGYAFHVHNLSMTSRRALRVWSCLLYCKAGKKMHLWASHNIRTFISYSMAQLSEEKGWGDRGKGNREVERQEERNRNAKGRGRKRNNCRIFCWNANYHIIGLLSLSI